MDIMPLSVVVFGAMPEAILMVWAGLTLVGKKPEIKRLILVGIIQGISTYYIRRYVDLGPHMMVQFISLVVLTTLVIRVNPITAIISNILSFTIVFLVEGTVSVIFKADIVYILSIGWRRILFLLPHDLILVWIVYICNKYDGSLLNEFGVLNKIIK